MSLTPASPNWLVGDGEMLRRVREFDWSRTPLGPLADWPASLRTTVATLLHARHPCFLWWGPELIQIYNDAYVPSFGVGKHPVALGQPGRECWPEIWPIIGPQIEAVMSRGVASWHEDALVPIFRDGAIQDVFWTYGYSPVFDEQGKIAGTLVLCTETTARVTAQREVERQRARLFEYFRQVPAGVCVFRGESLTFEYANEEYERFVGKGALAGQTLLSAMPELAGQGFDDLLQSVMRTGTPVDGHEVLVRQDRGGGLTDNYYTFNYSPFHDAKGNATGVIALVLNVTDNVLKKRETAELERRLREHEAALLVHEQQARRLAEQASRAKDEFLTTASHELRTPLNAILGWAHLLRTRTLEGDDYVRATESIERNARAQVRLIEDILDGSRIITGKLHLEIRSLNLSSLVKNATDALRSAADGKGITLDVALEPEGSKISGDPERLQQVIWNLVSNAIKFTPRGGKVEVSLTQAAAGVELAVRDTGEGISAEFLPHVFDRFRQADGGTSRRHGGLGLGLALVRHLTEAHGGTVHAESAGLGHGSRFTVVLPVQAAPRAAEGGEPARATPVTPVPTPSMLSGVSVLVVDDDKDSRELMSAVLRAKGAAVTTASNATRALELLAEQSFNVMVSDVGMPAMDGYELVRRARALAGTGAPAVPAIAVTAYGRDEDVRLALEAGFRAHVAKPFHAESLVQVVASHALGPSEGGERTSA